MVTIDFVLNNWTFDTIDCSCSFLVIVVVTLNNQLGMIEWMNKEYSNHKTICFFRNDFLFLLLQKFSRNLFFSSISLIWNLFSNSIHTPIEYFKRIFSTKNRKKSLKWINENQVFFMKEKRTSTQLTSRRSREKLIQKFNFQIKARCHHSLVLSPLFVCLCDHTYHYHASNTPSPLWDKIFVHHFLRVFFFIHSECTKFNNGIQLELLCCIVNVVVIDCILLNWIFKKKNKNILLDSATKQQHLANTLCKKKEIMKQNFQT